MCLEAHSVTRDRVLCFGDDESGLVWCGFLFLRGSWLVGTTHNALFKKGSVFRSSWKCPRSLALDPLLSFPPFFPLDTPHSSSKCQVFHPVFPHPCANHNHGCFHIHWFCVEGKCRGTGPEWICKVFFQTHPGCCKVLASEYLDTTQSCIFIYTHFWASLVRMALWAPGAMMFNAPFPPLPEVPNTEIIWVLWHHPQLLLVATNNNSNFS